MFGGHGSRRYRRGVTLLFVEFWQHECCGDLFEVGEAVVWPVAPVEGDALVSLLGVELGLRLQLAVDRHQDEARSWTGTVRSIHAVFHRQELVSDHTEGTCYRAVPGSAQLRSIERTQRREWLDDLEWAGYVVELSDGAEQLA